MSYLRLALINYESAQGTLPAMVVNEKNRTVQSSLHAALLPHLEQQKLFEHLDLASDWDTPHNLHVAESDDIFQSFVKMDGYGVFQLKGQASAWNCETGLPRVSLLEKSSSSILMVAVPVSRVEPFQPMVVTEEEMLQQLIDGKRLFFIRCDGRYGQINCSNGKLDFPLP